MNTRQASFLALVALLSNFPATASPLDWLFGKNDVEVIAVTDMTPEGRLTRAATPDDPVYYLAASLGFKDLGGIVAGDKIPPKDEVINMIGNALGKQGYRPATDATPPPTIVLVLCWGTLNTDTLDMGDPEIPPQIINRQQILKFLGGYKMGFSKNDFDPYTAPLMGMHAKGFDAREFYDAAADDYYVAIVAAYDLESIKEKKKKLLWTTRLSCPSRGYYMAEVLPTMMTVGKEYFGRETEKPAWIRTDNKFKPVFKFGELKFLDDPKPAPVPEIASPAADADKK